MIDLTGKDFFEVKDNFKLYKNVESKLLYGDRGSKKEVSIMIPTYLRNTYLPETIDSAVRQDTDVDYEIVVVDNNSDMEDSSTLDVVRKFDAHRVSYYKNGENLGMFGNWNRCLELANADWVLILHDDDTITEDYISQMWKIIVKYPDLGCVGCGHTKIDENSIQMREAPKGRKWHIAERLLTRESYEVLVKDFLYIHPINIMGLLVNKTKAMDIGGFDDAWNPTSDYIFIMNMAERFHVRCTDMHLLNYRKAVNASLSPKHLIGMVEVDAFMRKSINRHIEALDGSKADIFFSTIVLNHEDGLKNNWFSALDALQRKEVEDDYAAFNNFMNIRPVTYRERRKIVKKQGYYSFWIRFVRK